MAKGLTRRHFLKLSGQAVAAAGAATTFSGFPSPPAAEAATVVDLDGNEMVARVGDTFATITLVPKYTKTSVPKVIKAKVQYDTHADFSSARETAEIAAEYIVRSEDGKHVGPNDSQKLVASHHYKFVTGSWDIAAGDTIFNETDNSTMTVTQVVDDQNITGTLAGGTRNRWNKGDKWRLDRTYYRLEIKLTGLQPSTMYYYRVLVKFGTDATYPPARPAHSFRTRRVPGETFRFAIWADPHRSILPKRTLERRRWPLWDTFLQEIQQENVDFLMDLGDTWYLCDGHGKPHFKHWPELYSTVMRPDRNGPATYRGISDVCADCGYFMARGNHEGVSDYDHPKIGNMLSGLLKLFVPNPNGTTYYPQGGSSDQDYDQGYYAFEWGDALFIALDCIKYKDTDKVDPTAGRFHIGDYQLAWLTSVLDNSTQKKWKFIFAHHLFSGGNDYGRGGAAFAEQNDQAQVQALCEQYGAHYFHGHDHLLSVEWLHGVLYYCCGTPTMGKIRKSDDYYYPFGYTALTCSEGPDACENNGYMVVEVSPTQVHIVYKNADGTIIHDMTLT